MYTPHAGAIAPSSAREPDAPYKAHSVDIPPPAIAPDTRVTKTLAPGQPGTRAWSHHHGAALVCVRYRESADGTRRYTTIELVVDERVNRRPTSANLVEVSIGAHDQKNRQRLIQAGGIWNPHEKTWLLQKSAAQALRLPFRRIPT